VLQFEADTPFWRLAEYFSFCLLYRRDVGKRRYFLTLQVWQEDVVVEDFLAGGPRVACFGVHRRDGDKKGIHAEALHICRLAG
jgi:hypothetical protein